MGTGSPRSPRKLRVTTLEEWFDAGLMKTSSHVQGVVPLPFMYQGATADQLLLSQKESCVTIWPVRIDIGDLEKGKGLRKRKTLYHYMSEQSFDKARSLFSTGAPDLPMKILRLIKNDVRARSKGDVSNRKGEIRASIKEPALFASQDDVLFEVLAWEDPEGNDSTGVPLKEIAEYCVSFRVANTCIDMLDDGGRGQVKLNYEELLRQCWDVQQKSGNLKAQRSASMCSEEANILGLNVAEKPKMKDKVIGFFNSLKYDKDKARRRVAHKGQKEVGIGQWEEEVRLQMQEKKRQSTVLAVREQRMQDLADKRFNGRGTQSNSPSSPRGKRSSMAFVEKKSPGSPRSPRKSGAINPYENLALQDVEVSISSPRGVLSSPRASLAMKDTGSLRRKSQKRASLA